MYERLTVHQRITPMVNRYAVHTLGIDGREGELIAFAQQKRMALKEQVTFYADEDRSDPPLFAFKARSRLDVGAGHDVTGPAGEPIGWFKKEFRKSLTRSTWTLGEPSLGLEAVGRERSQGVAIVRRVWDIVLNDVPGPWRFHFDFTTADGTLVMSSERRKTLRDAYDVELPALPDGSRLDWRLGAAMAVALDALQSR
ncbi:hypothetical protein [Jiangella mangrovi]|uniref:Uncharacterized protein n=1 Tax=Jiangella mangrovi TaxID=1524084 RepID=A0A7W9LPC1_9ACTN|nr:hypothetical protein [Jiangella mangrovi]MBB5791215.1 hypothetical protein [Jiangella mangrovi]